MKKHMSRISAIVSAVFGLVFIILLICTAFGGLSSTDFDNKLVKILLFVFGGCYVAITATACALQFSDKVTVKEVQVAQGAGGNVKVTPAVIRGLIRKNVKALPGIKFGRMSLFLTEFGVQISLTVSCSGGRRAQETGAFLQALVADVCKRELDLEFRTINVKVTGFKSVYKPDIERIEAETQAMLGKEPEFPAEKEDPAFYEVVTPDAPAPIADADLDNNAPTPTESIDNEPAELSDRDPAENNDDPTATGNDDPALTVNNDFAQYFTGAPAETINDDSAEAAPLTDNNTETALTDAVDPRESDNIAMTDRTEAPAEAVEAIVTEYLPQTDEVEQAATPTIEPQVGDTTQEEQAEETEEITDDTLF